MESRSKHKKETPYDADLLPSYSSCLEFYSITQTIIQPFSSLPCLCKRKKETIHKHFA